MKPLLIYGHRLYNQTFGLLLGRKRLRLPTDVSVEQFLRELKDNNITYVIMRWFEDLPELKRGDDLDILVADKDYEKLRAKLTLARRGTPCDIYTATQASGGLYKKLVAYYSERLAKQTLKYRQWQDDYIAIPTQRDYFFTLAYHAVYHKGLKSGLPTQTQLTPLARPAHDFTGILSRMADELGIECEVTMEGLADCLAQNDFAPNGDTLTKLAQVNDWVRHTHG